MGIRRISGFLGPAIALVSVLTWAPGAWAVHQHCGDGVVDKGEGCDDGNRVNGDGCSAICKSEMLPCGLPDPSAATCSRDAECGFGNECVRKGCTPSVCGCSDVGPVICTKDCQGSCIKKEPRICTERTQPGCGDWEGTSDVLCPDENGVATLAENADKCWTDGDCGPKGLCVRPGCVSSGCSCAPGIGWGCTDDCSGAGGRECRYPGDRLPPGHPICVAEHGSQNSHEPCLYPAEVQSMTAAPVLGGMGALLGLGLLGLYRRKR